MSDVTKIKIAKVGRKEMPSKFKEGETYSITTILDEISGRKGTGIGKFSDGWKVGDTIEGIWEKRMWKDKDGFEQESWNIKNPNATPAGGKGGTWGPRKATLVDAYTVAAALAPILFKDKKTIKLDDISALADALMKKFGASITEKKAEGADVDLSKEDAPAKKKVGVKEDTDFEVAETTAAKTIEDTEDEDEEDPF